MMTPAFTFDDVSVTPDRQIGLHSHTCWELSYLLCGGGERTIGDLTEPVSHGEIVLIPPHIPHVWRFDPRITDSEGHISNISVFFEPGLISAMRNLFPEIAPSLERIELQPVAVRYTGGTYHTLKELLLAMRGMPSDRRLPKMIKLLLAISDFSEICSVGQRRSLSRTEQRFEKVRIYCSCNYASPLSLVELSRYAGMNKSAFCTFMRRHTGMTLSAYINAIRLGHAKEKLLHSDCSIAEIAIDCGFQNIAYFNRLFRTRYGCSPKEIRSGKEA